MNVGDKVAYIDFRNAPYDSCPIGTITEIEYIADRYFYQVKWNNPLHQDPNPDVMYADYQLVKIIMPGDKVDDSFQDLLGDSDINDADWWKNGPTN